MVLEEFPRPLQVDGYSCGAQCTHSVLRWHGTDWSRKKVQRKLGTTTEGTDQDQIHALLEERGLRPKYVEDGTLKTLRSAIDKGWPCIVSVDGDHWACVFGYQRGTIFVGDPAVGRGPSVLITTKKFKERWAGGVMVVRD